MHYAVALDDAEVGTTYDTAFAVALPDADPHTVTVTPIDEAGNAGPASSTSAEASDTQAPQLVGLTRTPASVDVGSAYKDVTFTVQASDDLSGINAFLSGVDLRSPTGVFAAEVTPFTLVSGDSAGGTATYSQTLRVPKSGEAGTWTVSVGFFDVVGHISLFTSSDLAGVGLPNSVAVANTAPSDTTPPTTVATGADSLWHNAPVTVTLTPTDNAGGSGMTGGSAKTEYKLDSGEWTIGTSLTVPAPANGSNDGEHTVLYRSTDAAGNEETAGSVIVKIDASAPALATLTSATHPVEATWYASNAPSLAWTASDTSGITGYSYVIDHAATTVPDAVSEGTATSKTYTTALADGVWYFHLRARNGAGLWGATKTRMVRIDASAPSGTFALAGGAATTTTTAVNGGSSVSDAHGPLEMRFSSDGKATWSSWEAYAAAKALTLPGGLGAKTVYAQYRDAAGNVLELSDAIMIITPPDATAPTVESSGVAEGSWHRRAVLVTLTAADSGSGVATITYTLDGVETSVPGALALVSVPASPNGPHTLTYHATDAAANTCADQTLSFTTDTKGPVTAARATSGRKGHAVTLRYKLSDNLSPKAKAIRIVVRNRRGRAVKTIRPTTKNTARWYSVKWKPKAKGTYRYYVYGKDLAGNPQRIKGSARVVVR